MLLGERICYNNGYYDLQDGFSVDDTQFTGDDFVLRSPCMVTRLEIYVSMDSVETSIGVRIYRSSEKFKSFNSAQPLFSETIAGSAFVKTTTGLCCRELAY